MYVLIDVLIAFTMVVCIPTRTKTAKNQHFEYTPGWSLYYYCLLSALNRGVGQSSWVVLNELQPLQCIRILIESSLAVGLDLLNFVPVHVRPDWCSHIITMVVCIPTCTKTAKNQHFEYTPGWPGRNTVTQVNLFLSNCSLGIIYIKWLYC